MIIVWRFLFFCLAVLVGVLFVVKSDYFVRLFGHNELAERYLGGGGTYWFWKLLGLALIVLGCLALVGSLDFVFYPFGSYSSD